MKKLLIPLILILFLFGNSTFAQKVAYISKEKAVQDLNQLFNTFERVHYNPYFKTKKDSIYHLKKIFINNWPNTVAYKSFIATGMKLCALMSGGHSNMDWQNPNIIPEIQAHYYLPFTGTLNDSQSFQVTRSRDSYIKEGTVIRSVNGIEMVDLFKECMTYTGGIEAFKMANVEVLFPLYLFFNEELQPPYSITIDGVDESLLTKGLDIGQLVDFLNADQAIDNYTFEIIEEKIGLISYNRCEEYEKFGLFLKETFKAIDTLGLDKLIIDIRENSGGDSRLNDLLLSYITTDPYRQGSGRYWKVSQEAKDAYTSQDAFKEIFGVEFMTRYLNTPNQEVIVDMDTTMTYPETPKSFFTGKTCILIDTKTFSSANMLADAVKTYNISTLIGIATGEYTNDFGELLSFELTNSSSTVYISSTYDIGASGDANCISTVKPDIEVNNDPLGYAIMWVSK